MADPSPPIHGAAFAGIALRVDPLILADTIECRRGDGVVVANMVLTGNSAFVLPRPGHEAHEAGEWRMCQATYDQLISRLEAAGTVKGEIMRG